MSHLDSTDHADQSVVKPEKAPSCCDNPLKWAASKFTAGSIKGSILELISATIGAGVLTLPYAFGQSGLAFSIFQVLCCAFLGYYSTRLLARCGNMAKRYSYPDIAAVTYGPPFQFLVRFIFFLNNWGGCLIYTILITNMIGTGLTIFFQGDNIPSFLTATNSLFWPPVYTTLIIYPLSLNRDLSALRYACLVGFGFIMYLSFVVGFECFTNSNYVQNFENASQLTLTGVGVTFPTIVFSYSCHPNVLDVFHELKRSNIRRMSKVLYRAMGVACCVFMLVGSFGYITFVDDMSALNGPQNILMSFKYKNWPTVTIVAVLCIGVSIILAMPLSIKPSKDSLRELLFTKYVKPNKDYLLNPEPVVKVKESTCLHVTLVTFVVFSQMLCGMFVQKMESVITLMGATAYPMICYIFPCMFFLKLDKNPWYSKEKLFCIFMIVSMSLLGLYCTYSFFANNS